jgi:hypothetical protein
MLCYAAETNERTNVRCNAMRCDAMRCGSFSTLQSNEVKSLNATVVRETYAQGFTYLAEKVV